MENYTNSQIADIISQSAIRIENFVSKLEKENADIEFKIVELKTLLIEPDLTHLNSYYIEKTQSNIEQLNKKIKVPRLSLYVWGTSFLMFFASFIVFIFTFWKTDQLKIQTQKEYKEKLMKNKVIISTENAKLLKDMDLWFKSDPESTGKFIRWRINNK
jgi:hypothetical protein